MIKLLRKLFREEKAPHWSREIPSELGWYFWRNLDDTINGPFPVQPVMVDEWIKRNADDGGEYWTAKIDTPPGTPAPWKE